MNELARRPCCGNCVFFHAETVGIVDWEYNEQHTWNFCVLQDFEILGGELFVTGEGDRNKNGSCKEHEPIHSYGEKL